MSLDWEKINYCKINYIDKRNRENEKIALENGLTEEQIEAIEDICRWRHEIHALDTSCTFCSQAADNDLISDNLDYINEAIDDNNLPKLGIDKYDYAEKWMTDYELIYDFYVDEFRELAQKKVDEGYKFDSHISDVDELAWELYYEYGLEVNSELKEEINNKIEQWLRDIDEAYGTHYCPTGGQRI